MYITDKVRTEKLIEVTLKDYAMATFCFTDNDSEEYGWTEATISDTRILKGNNGFYLNLPDPIKL